jgi:ATP-dependent Clp protease ATP-binding subunit ClpA
MADRDRFDKFTERARRVLSYAQEEAQRFQHNYIGTEHLLLGLVREEDGVAAKVLQALGVQREQVHNAITFIIGRGDRIVLGEIGLTPRAKKVIELAVDEARRLNHHYIGTEHILLGLAREGEGIATGVLESLGVNLERVRTATIRVLSGEDPVREGDPPPNLRKESFRKYYMWRPGAHFINMGFGGYTPTEGAAKVLPLAAEEAFQLQHSYLGPEHLLLGLISEKEGIAAKVLANAGVDLTRARTTVEQVVGRGTLTAGNIEPSPLTLAYILLGVDEASKLKQTTIGTEHLLLGLIREKQGIIAEIFSNLGIDLDTIRANTLQMIQA